MRPSSCLPTQCMSTTHNAERKRLLADARLTSEEEAPLRCRAAIVDFSDEIVVFLANDQHGQSSEVVKAKDRVCSEVDVANQLVHVHGRLSIPHAQVYITGFNVLGQAVCVAWNWPEALAKRFIAMRQWQTCKFEQGSHEGQRSHHDMS
jgi:hypothetical protein